MGHPFCRTNSVRGYRILALIFAAFLPGCVSTDIIRSKETDLKMAKETMNRLRQVAIAVEEYAVEQNAYPIATTIDELIVLVDPRHVKILPRVDAWGTGFSYEVATDHTHYRLMSAGADRSFQPERLHTPIGSWRPGPRGDLAADIVFEDGAFVQWPDARL
jgi:Type II secretion system (T2SS), protein G